MKDHERKSRAYTVDEKALRQQTQSRGGGPSGGGGGGRSKTRQLTPDGPSLSDIFNAAAKPPSVVKQSTQISSKMQIEALEKKLSRMQPTYELSMLGTINNGYRPDADRKLRHEIRTMQADLDRKKGISQEFTNKAKQMTLTRNFNQQSLRGGISF